MDLAALQMFQMVASERSYSRAAVKLFRTQPAISIAMRKLEDWVGQPLFVRGSGARTLTDAGTLLLEYAERMLNMREEIRKGLQELRGLERGQQQPERVQQQPDQPPRSNLAERKIGQRRNRGRPGRVRAALRRSSGENLDGDRRIGL